MEYQRYQTAIIGGGAAGLFCGALTETESGIIIEAMPEPGRKLRAAGSGHCNLTHGGNIKDFIEHYGENGRKIRQALYRYSNARVTDFFRENGVPTCERGDGKIFPESMDGEDVRRLLVDMCLKNGWKIAAGMKIKEICAPGGREEDKGKSTPGGREEDNGICVPGGREEDKGISTPGGQDDDQGWLSVSESGGMICSDKLVITTGGKSYPELGSDGSMFDILGKLGIGLVHRQPALVPVFAENYPFAELSGISFADAEVRIRKDGRIDRKRTGSLLLTHKNFSGPVILDLSRYINAGTELEICFYKGERPDCRGVKRSLAHFLAEETGLPERFVRKIAELNGTDPDIKAASAAGGDVKKIFVMLGGMAFHVSGRAGFDQAMVTAGGVSLDEVDIRTFASKKHPGLFLAGEVLDVDGDTGGYNLQFAFSSAAAVAESLKRPDRG